MPCDGRRPPVRVRPRKAAVAAPGDRRVPPGGCAGSARPAGAAVHRPPGRRGTNWSRPARTWPSTSGPCGRRTRAASRGPGHRGDRSADLPAPAADRRSHGHPRLRPGAARRVARPPRGRRRPRTGPGVLLQRHPPAGGLRRSRPPCRRREAEARGGHGLRPGGDGGGTPGAEGGRRPGQVRGQGRAGRPWTWSGSRRASVDVRGRYAAEVAQVSVGPGRPRHRPRPDHSPTGR